MESEVLNRGTRIAKSWKSLNLLCDTVLDVPKQWKSLNLLCDTVLDVPKQCGNRKPHYEGKL